MHNSLDNLSVETLGIILLLLVVVSAFFSGSEIGMMSINRYKLKHASKTQKKARDVKKLLDNPDKLLGIILIGNTFANIAASACATILFVRLFGEIGIFIATFALTFVLLIVSEVSPKTIAAVYPEKVAFFAAPILHWLIKIFKPALWLVNNLSNALIKSLNLSTKQKTDEYLNKEQLRTIITDSTNSTVNVYKNMLLKVIDLDAILVDDIMLTKSEIVSLDLEQDLTNATELFNNPSVNSILIYAGSLENIIGWLDIKDSLKLIKQEQFNASAIQKICSEATFIPQNIPLRQQLTDFQSLQYKNALIVDEYGAIIGLITLHDILEQIIGEFARENNFNQISNLHPNEQNSYLVDGSTNISTLNKELNLHLPTTHAKTISGLIIYLLEEIPNKGTCIAIKDHVIEVVQVKENTVKTAKISKRIKTLNKPE